MLMKYFQFLCLPCFSFVEMGKTARLLREVKLQFLERKEDIRLGEAQLKILSLSGGKLRRTVNHQVSLKHRNIKFIHSPLPFRPTPFTSNSFPLDSSRFDVYVRVLSARR